MCIIEILEFIPLEGPWCTELSFIVPIGDKTMTPVQDTRSVGQYDILNIGGDIVLVLDGITLSPFHDRFQIL